MTIGISATTAYRCECGHLSEEVSNEPLYECSNCGEKGSGEDARRCSSCNKFCSKIADKTCIDCGEGEVEEVGAYVCDNCGDPFDAEDIHEHVLDCAADAVRLELAERELPGAVKITAIECPYCGVICAADSDALAEHFGDGYDCTAWKEDTSDLIDKAVARADEAQAEADKKARLEADQRAIEADKLKTAAKAAKKAAKIADKNKETA